MLQLQPRINVYCSLTMGLLDCMMLVQVLNRVINTCWCVAGISAAVTDSLGPPLVCPKEVPSR